MFQRTCVDAVRTWNYKPPPVKDLFFLSDLHITSMEDEKAQKLLRFLSSLDPKKSELFLVGDIFDLWLGGHDFFKKSYEPLLSQVRTFVQEGGQIHYFEGNHDLHLKGYWEKELGAKVYGGPTFFERDSLQLRVEHGDQMNPKDYGYIFLRWFLRTFLMRWLILSLPGFLVNAIGRKASGLSRSFTHQPGRAESIKEMIRTHAEKVHPLKNYDILISGHVHVRDEYHFQRDERQVSSYNLGCWDDSAQILMYNGTRWSWLPI